MTGVPDLHSIAATRQVFVAKTMATVSREHRGPLRSELEVEGSTCQIKLMASNGWCVFVFFSTLQCNFLAPIVNSLKNLPGYSRR